MTHMSNYGNDRLALYTFEAATKFIQCWTNLQLQSIPALQLAEKYFRMYPEETEPIWGVNFHQTNWLFIILEVLLIYFWSTKWNRIPVMINVTWRFGLRTKRAISCRDSLSWGRKKRALPLYTLFCQCIRPLSATIPVQKLSKRYNFSTVETITKVGS